MRSYVPLAAILLAACGGPRKASDGQVVEEQQAITSLSRPDAEYPTPFSRLTGLRELSNGKVLVSDSREKLVALIDFATGTSVSLGRQGPGPGEYTFPGQLFGQPNGGTLLSDVFARRLLLIADTGMTDDVVRTPAEVGMEFGNGDAESDDHGRIYFRAPIRGRGRRTSGRTTETLDSLTILRWDPVSSGLDTAGWLAIKVKMSTDGGSGSVSVGGDQIFGPGDAWAVAGDGAVARVTPNPYRVIWYENGKATLGPIQPYIPIQVTEADRRAVVEKMKGQTGMAISMNLSGVVTRVVEEPEPLDTSNLVFAETKPPFLAGVHATPEGEVWVLRTRPAQDTLPRYDVFDRKGNLRRQVTLNPSSQVFAFGRGTVYVLRIDGDDLQHLQRFKR